MDKNPTNPKEKLLWSVAFSLANNAACGAAYKKSWGADYALKTNEEIWTNQDSFGAWKRKPSLVTVKDLREIGVESLRQLGFSVWDEKGLVLIPIYAYNYIADGETLVCIDGKEVVKTAESREMGSANYIDLDVRAGCIAFGFKL